MKKKPLGECCKEWSMAVNLLEIRLPISSSTVYMEFTQTLTKIMKHMLQNYCPCCGTCLN